MTTNQHLSEQLLRTLAERLSGPVASIVPLVGEHDLNFRVDLQSGDRRILKIHALTTDTDALAMQDAALQHVRAHVPSVNSPGLHGIAKIEGTGDPKLDGRVVRILDWINGDLWSRVEPQIKADESLLRDLGAKVALLDVALQNFDHRALDRPHRWNMTQASSLDLPNHKWAAEQLRNLGPVLSALRKLPQQAIHNDANENNIIVSIPTKPGQARSVASLIDFGDIVRAPRIVGLAVAVAYAMFDSDDPLVPATAVVSGYHGESPLRPYELALLDSLVRARLAMSVANAEAQIREHPENAEYLSTSQKDVLDTIASLEHVEPAFAHAVYRSACGLAPIATARDVRNFFLSTSFDPAPIVDADLSTAIVKDFSATSSAGALNKSLSVGEIALGRYREERTVYDTDAFATPSGERRTVHLGIDVFVPAGSAVYAPLDGVVHASEIRDERGDYGGVIMLEHRTANNTPFWLLLGHLSHASVAPNPARRVVKRGEKIAEVGRKEENGGWAPHIHAHMYVEHLGRSTDLPGVVRKSQVHVWDQISPNPAPLLNGVDAKAVEVPRVHDATSITKARRRNLSPSLSLSYREPLHIVRGEGASLIDAAGTRWLDLVNNVAHVGHEHPHVVRAVQEQVAALNTNTRYLHPNIVEYSERIRGLFPDPLSVAFFTNSGSEANDLALRIARTATKREGVLALDWGYHGNLSSLIEVSPYKFNRKGGNGPSERVRVCALADPYRGAHGGSGASYAVSVERQAADLTRSGLPPAAFIHESISGCGGQVDLAPGYLPVAYKAARDAGALCIADEVQTGLGRVGSHMWAFDRQLSAAGIVPDIVTMGKPLGNGHPLGIVITTAELARKFRTGMEYFNTFGGNPVSCAAGLAVLDVIESERLQAHADVVGAQLQNNLRALMSKHEAIGDVRGAGLFIGVDLVLNRESKQPATGLTAEVVEGMKAQGVLVSSDGPHDNVLKIKPPMVISEAECSRVVEALDRALSQR